MVKTRARRYTVNIMYFFVPGSHPKISRAEIESLDKDLNLVCTTDNIFIGDSPNAIGELLNKSAGIVKAGVVFSAIEKYNKNILAAIMQASIESGVGKLLVGISVYDAGGANQFQILKKDQQRLGLTLKSLLKQTGRPVRFVTSRGPTLSSVVIQKNKLTENGAEFVLIVTPDKILLGQTTFVQDFESWGHRDYGRPARDAKSGMLPPKLARIMINLSGVEPIESSLWDPFCGSGTILMEAALLGYKKIFGSDVSQKAVDNTARNLKWLQHYYNAQGTVEAFVHDASAVLPSEFGEFDAIVGEGYLGPPQKRSIGAKISDETKKELELFYKKVLPQILSRLKPDGVAIIAFPFFQISGKRLFLDITIPNGYEIERMSNTDTSRNGGLVYARHEHIVGREILKIKRSHRH